MGQWNSTQKPWSNAAVQLEIKNNLWLIRDQHHCGQVWEDFLKLSRCMVYGAKAASWTGSLIWQGRSHLCTTCLRGMRDKSLQDLWGVAGSLHCSGSGVPEGKASLYLQWSLAWFKMPGLWVGYEEQRPLWTRGDLTLSDKMCVQLIIALERFLKPFGAKESTSVFQIPDCLLFCLFVL